MWKMKAHGLVLAHKAFCRVFYLVGFFDGDFFSMWAFLTLAHMGQGQALWAEPN